MNHASVTSLVVEKASRFGDQNPQEIAFLQSRLSQIEPQELLDGLLSVFSEANELSDRSQQQELAGRLLETLKPQGSVQLEAFLRRAATRYELSVEQLPQHLARLCGREEVVRTLRKLGADPDMLAHRRALETMAFWLEARLEAAA